MGFVVGLHCTPINRKEEITVTAKSLDEDIVMDAVYYDNVVR
jgi:hypothetical protein